MDCETGAAAPLAGGPFAAGGDLGKHPKKEVAKKTKRAIFPAR